MLQYVKDLFLSFFQMWKLFLHHSRLSIINLYKTFVLVVGICTGYPFEIIINAFTISSLIQIVLKVTFAIISIKINVIIQMFLLFGLLPIYIRYKAFDYFNEILAKFLLKFLPENCYEELNPDRDDEFYEYPEDENDKWYNHILLSFIHFFIFLRLVLLAEPILSIILKFIAIRYFIINEHLLVAYTISLVFIFSRFIFFLSDKTLSYWKLVLEDVIENAEESPKITKKNILIMTHWSLRYIMFWEECQKRRNDSKPELFFSDRLSFKDGLKDKFNLEHDKIHTIPKNRYCIKGMFFISFLIFFYYIIIINQYFIFYIFFFFSSLDFSIIWFTKNFFIIYYFKR